MAEQRSARVPNFDKARERLLSGSVAEALAEFERCVEQGVAPVASRFYYGLCRFRLDDFAAAIEDFEEVVRLEPWDHIAHFYAGLCYERLGRAADARRSRQLAYEMSDRLLAYPAERGQTPSPGLRRSA
jgi:tetratricopeptide (TPR) repeat protein